MNQRKDMFGRTWWNIKAANGAIIRVIDDPKNAYFQIATPAASFQCPKGWLTIKRHLDEYNPPGTHQSQTIVLLSITAPDIDYTLATLLLDPDEFAQISGDLVLGKLSGSENLSRMQCMPESEIDFEFELLKG